jgi:2-polyprenyl-6-methoxyphenol hydroxylase-like FAD-dependent oxidoreductase
MANGACLAIEDSYYLGHLLGRKSLSNSEAFATFQQMRSKKVDKVVNQSYLLGKLMHQDNKLFNYLIVTGMALTPQFLFNKIYSAILEEPMAK